MENQSEIAESSVNWVVSSAVSAQLYGCRLTWQANQEATLAVTGRRSADHTEQIAQLTARLATPKKLDGWLAGWFIQGEAERPRQWVFV